MEGIEIGGIVIGSGIAGVLADKLIAAILKHRNGKTTVNVNTLPAATEEFVTHEEHDGAVALVDTKLTAIKEDVQQTQTTIKGVGDAITALTVQVVRVTENHEVRIGKIEEDQRAP